MANEKTTMGDKVSISLIVTLEDILRSSGSDWEIIYLPDTGTYVLKLNDEIAHII